MCNDRTNCHKGWNTITSAALFSCSSSLSSALQSKSSGTSARLLFESLPDLPSTSVHITSSQSFLPLGRLDASSDQEWCASVSWSTLWRVLLRSILPLNLWFSQSRRVYCCPHRRKSHAILKVGLQWVLELDNCKGQEERSQVFVTRQATTPFSSQTDVP